MNGVGLTKGNNQGFMPRGNRAHFLRPTPKVGMQEREPKAAKGSDSFSGLIDSRVRVKPTRILVVSLGRLLPAHELHSPNGWAVE